MKNKNLSKKKKKFFFLLLKILTIKINDDKILLL